MGGSGLGVWVGGLRRGLFEGRELGGSNSGGGGVGDGPRFIIVGRGGGGEVVGEMSDLMTDEEYKYLLISHPLLCRFNWLVHL